MIHYVGSLMPMHRHCVRAAKEMDSKSIGLCPQGLNPLGVVKQSVCLAGADTKQPGAWRAGRVWPVPLIKQSVFDWRYYW